MSDDLNKALVGVRNQLNKKVWREKLRRLYFCDIFSALDFRRNSCGKLAKLRGSWGPNLVTVSVRGRTYLFSLFKYLPNMISDDFGQCIARITQPTYQNKWLKDCVFILEVISTRAFFTTQFIWYTHTLCVGFRPNPCLWDCQRNLSCHSLVQLPATNDLWLFGQSIPRITQPTYQNIWLKNCVFILEIFSTLVFPTQLFWYAR
jgi:hypothetical protein